MHSPSIPHHLPSKPLMPTQSATHHEMPDPLGDHIELEISFFCDCSICKGHYHDFEHSNDSTTACLDSVDIGIDEKNLEEMRRRIINDMERNLYKLQVRSHKKRLNVKEKGEEDRKKRRGKEGYLYRDISTYSLKDCDENSKKNVLSARYNSEYYDKDDLRDEKKWLFKRQHKRLFNRMDMPVIH